MSKIKTKLLIVDDHQLLIDGICNMINNHEFSIVAKAHNTEEALQVLSGHKIDILVTDINMPGEDGLYLIDKVKKRYPDVKIVVLTMYDDRSIVLEAIRLKVNAYLLKNITQQQFYKALQFVESDKFYISEELSHLLAERIQIEDDNRILSKRELEVLRLVAKEYSNKQIAKALFISERTVESHRKNIFRKTNTKSVIGLIKYAINNKLI